MRRIFLPGLIIGVAAMATMTACAQGAVVLAQEDFGGSPMPAWVKQMVAAILAVVMIAVLVWFTRPKAGAGGADFRILVDGEDVVFKGRFPENLEGMVADFLVRDCGIQDPYEVRGSWEEGRLAVRVIGDQAKFQEQRIRNFLKLHVKRPGQ